MADRTKRVALAVSAYDRVTCWVVSWNLLVAVGVVVLFVSWLGSRQIWEPKLSQPARHGNGTAVHAVGFAAELEPPSGDDFALESEQGVEAMLESVADLVATEAAHLDSMQCVALGDKRGVGYSDVRSVGQWDVIPAGERWQIQYIANSLDTYRQQLDYFGIELGVAGGGVPHVDYAFDLLQDSPHTRSGPGGESEQRLYMLWTAGVLRQFDRQLLQAAGITTAGRITLQFYPTSVVDTLAGLETAHARRHGQTGIDQIMQTVFGVRRLGNGFEYFVVSQRYRAAAL